MLIEVKGVWVDLEELERNLSELGELMSDSGDGVRNFDSLEDVVDYWECCKRCMEF